MSMKNKNGLYIGAIIVLVIALISIVSVVFLFNKQGEEKEKEDNSEQTEFVHYNYLDELDEASKKVGEEFDKKYEEYHLSNINMISNKVTDFDTLENKQKLDLVANYYDYNKEIEGYAGKTFDDKLTSDDFKTYFKDVFNKDITFENTNLLCNTNETGEYCQVLFNVNDGTYTYNEGYQDHERILTEEVYSKLIKATHEDNIYTLTYIKIFNRIGDNVETDFYDNYNFNDLDDEPVITKPEDVDGYDPLELVSNALNKKSYDDLVDYNKYIYTVDMTDDEPYLVGYEVGK